MADQEGTAVAGAAAGADNLRTMAVIVHGLNLAAAFNGISALIAVIIAYMKRGEAAGTPWEGHFTYAIYTFWIGFLGFVVSFLLAFILIGLLGFLAIGLWWLVRCIFALLKAIDRQPIPNPDSLML